MYGLANQIKMSGCEKSKDNELSLRGAEGGEDLFLFVPPISS